MKEINLLPEPLIAMPSVQLVQSWLVLIYKYYRLIIPDAMVVCIIMVHNACKHLYRKTLSNIIIRLDIKKVHYYDYEVLAQDLCYRMQG